jgi:RHS repeat-associated protein
LDLHWCCGSGNRLLQAGRIAYKYDADGRIIEKTSAAGNKIERWKFDWSSEGRLKSVINPKGEKWQYRYDAFGRRVEKIGKNGTTRYIWDGAVIAAEISPEDKTTEWTFEDSSFRPLAKISDGQVFSAINDQSGKPLELFDKSGETAWRMKTNLWSVPVAEQPIKTDCNLRFQGQWYDEESGLHYNFHRYYDPETGRYLSNDPIGLDGGFNTYAYSHNPLVWIDPLGLDNISTGDGRDHVTYRGMKGGKSYTGYASAPSNLHLTPEQIIARRYGGDFSGFGGRPPASAYSGSGAQGKRVARGLEQHYFEQDVARLGRNNVANVQSPVGPYNPRKGLYQRAKEGFLKGGCK